MCWCGRADAACTGASPSWAATAWIDVQTCHDNAGFLNGDTITLASGAISATTTFTGTKQFILTGATCTVDANSRATSCPVVITNNVAAGQQVINLTLVANLTTRIHDLEFATGTGTGTTMQLNGASITDSRRIRVDHVKTTNTAGVVFFVYGAYGVIDHSTFAGNVPAYLAQINGNSVAGTYGNDRWAAGALWGTESFLFFENDTFDNSGCFNNLTMLDGRTGGRWVVRYSSIICGLIDGHGTENPHDRGTMATEIYNTIFTFLNNTQMLYQRSGAQTIHDNGIYSPAGPVTANLDNPRLVDSFEVWGMGDGRNQWDVNDAGNPFDTAIVTTGGTSTVTASAESWSVNQWAGYQVRKTGGTSVKTCTGITRIGTTATATCVGHGFANGNLVSVYGTALQTGNLSGYSHIRAISNVAADTFDFTLDGTAGTPANVAGGEILATLGNWSMSIASNTATVLTLNASIYGGGYAIVFQVGDTFEINKITHTLDNIGRTGGSAISDADGPSPPGGWNDQTTIGSYQWANTRCTSSPPTVGCVGTTEVSFSPSQPQITSGVHYFDATARPGYTPYIYPHPLDVSVAPPIASIQFLEAGTDATEDISFYNSSSGTVTSDTTTFYTSPASLKLDTGAGATVAYVEKTNVLNDTGSRLSFRFKINTLPAVDAGNMISVSTGAGAANVWTIQLQSTGKINLNPVGATNSSGTTVLTTNTWNRISINYVITSTTVYQIQLYLNGVLEAIANAGTLTRTGSNTFRIVAAAAWGANRVLNVDDIYIDNGTNLVDPGDIRVTAKLPTTRTHTGYSTLVGSGAVNERPASAANARKAPNSGATVTEGYDIQSAATGDNNILGTIRGYSCWTLTKTDAVGVNAVVMLQCNGFNGSDLGAVLTVNDLIFTSIVTTTDYPTASPMVGQSSLSVAGELPQVEDLGIIVAYTDVGVPGIRALIGVGR
jgi:hypothetical protein